MENWIILNSTTGNSGETQITLQVAENTNYSARTTTLTVRTRSKNLTDTVVINQQAKAESGSTSEYLTFEIISGGTIYWACSDTASTKTIEYQINGGFWNSITSSYSSPMDSTGGTAINVSAGDIVKFRGDNNNYSVSTSSKINYFKGSTCKFKLKGNIMSLINSVNFENLKSFNTAYNFVNLFYNCTGLTDTSELLLPATALTFCCYWGMFEGCTSLTTVPELPATTLANWCYTEMFKNCTSLSTVPSNYLPVTTLAISCYSNMFQNCTSLTAAPKLPATTLARECYSNMFNGCTSLTTAPELPATTLTYWCYYQMFSGCTNLNYIKCLATDISASKCTENWVLNVAPTGTFVKADSMNDWIIDSVDGVPIGWTLINASDENPDYSTEPLTFEIISGGTIYWKVSTEFAKTIEYQKNNDNWVSIRSTSTGVPITVSVNDIIKFRGNNTCYAVNAGYTKYNTFSGTTAEFKVKGNIMSLIDSTNFENINTFSDEYNFAYLFSNCTGLTDISNLILPVTTLTNGCYEYMFQGCTSLTTVPALPATTLAQGCYRGMFNGCTSLTTVPTNYLPVTTLADWCYANMFQSCTSLTTAPELPATNLTSNCYYYMFYGCNSLTTAPVLSAAILTAETCYSHMFYGCSSLNYIKCLATTNNLGSNCIVAWVQNVASTGTFVKAANATFWSRGINGIPTGWTVQDAT